MKLIHGFQKITETNIDEISSKATVYRHEKTGARVLSLVNDDENKVFGIGFNTPPEDSTGLPHILEHSVLCGSEKYPVKEPFVELLKGSLQTFLNAMTFPDKTCYPVASANLQDFYNLVDVYLDAVFFPRLNENVLRQEGWHYELEKPEDPLVYKGVVFNEMKGAYSSPDSLLYETSQNSLFPDTAYGLDSGGDPEKIPNLTFEQFENFHHERYHPSNAYAFFNGDDDPTRRLMILDEYFSRFDKADPVPPAQLQAPFSEPRAVVRPYAASDDDAKSQFVVNYALPESGDISLNLAFQVLAEALTGLASSPLRKALSDSDLGEDIAGFGLETDIRQMIFSVGLKGIDREKAPEVERVITRTLEGLVRDGLEQEDVEAAVNSVEFELRENNTGSYPRGLGMMFRVLSTWLYDDDKVVDLLQFEKPLSALKARLAAGDNTLERLIQTHFLENTHRCTVLLYPDTELAARTSASETERLTQAKNAMQDDDIEQIIQETEELKDIQATPDSTEALAVIPRLTVEDLPRLNQNIPIELYGKGESKTLFHNLHANGIVYLDVGFDVKYLPDHLLPYVPIFGRALKEMGTKKRDYASLLRQIARYTGGIEPQTLVAPKRDDQGCVSTLFLRCKATEENTGHLVDLLHEMVFEPDFANPERFRRIVLEAKARAEQSLIPAGHAYVTRRIKAFDANAEATQAHIADELMHGVSNLFFLRELAERVTNDFDGVLKDLEEIRSLLACTDALTMNVTSGSSGFEKVLPGLSGMIHDMPSQQCAAPFKRSLLNLPTNEGLAIPAQINYAGRGGNAFTLGYEPSGAAHVVSKFLRAGYLWENVRVLGGAYGAFCSYDRTSGSLAFVSYRDPNLDKTLVIFDQVADYLANITLDKGELEKGIVGAIGEMDSYMLPDARGFTSLTRHLTGETDEFRQQVREEILSATQNDFRNFAEAVRAVVEQGQTVVMGAQEALEASERIGTVTKVL